MENWCKYTGGIHAFKALTCAVFFGIVRCGVVFAGCGSLGQVFEALPLVLRDLLKKFLHGILPPGETSCNG